MAKKRGPQQRSPRVAAWVHTVLNPWIDALPREAALLRAGNPTWRHYSRELELVRPMAEYVSPLALRTVDDLLRARPEVARFVARHDDLRDQLQARCGSAADHLVARADFQQLVAARLDAHRTGREQAYPGGGVEEARFPWLVAQHVVNGITELPPHYTDALFWKLYGPEFLAKAAGPELAAVGAATAALRDHDAELVGRVRDWHFDLCEEFDVPPAPASP